MTSKDLAKLFPLEVPLADKGLFWNGKPDKWSNLPQYHIELSQRFGSDPTTYAQFGLAGHNGVDLAGLKRTPIVAPCRIWTTLVSTNPNDGGYGLHVEAESETKTVNGETYKLDFVFGHMDETVAKAAHWYERGDLIGYMDSTGFSSGSHCHFGVRPWLRTADGGFKLLFPNNGFKGSVDPEDYIVTHLVWDWRELSHPEQFNKEKFMLDNEKKVVIEGEGKGRKGVVVNGKLQEIKEGREAVAALYVMANNDLGITVSSKTFDELPKDKDF